MTTTVRLSGTSRLTATSHRPARRFTPFLLLGLAPLVLLAACSGSRVGDAPAATVQTSTTQVLHVPVRDAQGSSNTLDLSVTDDLNPEGQAAFYDALQRTDPTTAQKVQHDGTLGADLVLSTTALAAQHIASQHALADTVTERDFFVRAIAQDLTAVLQREHPDAFRTFTVRWIGLNGTLPMGSTPLATATVDATVRVDPTPAPWPARAAMTSLPPGTAEHSVLMVPGRGWSVVAERAALRPLLSRDDLARIASDPGTHPATIERERRLAAQAQAERDAIRHREDEASRSSYTPIILYTGSGVVIF